MQSGIEKWNWPESQLCSRSLNKMAREKQIRVAGFAVFAKIEAFEILQF